MKFPDYTLTSEFIELRKAYIKAKELGVLDKLKFRDPPLSFIVEQIWTDCRRPYFNVYPGIASKLLSMPDTIESQEIRLPVSALEVRTSTSTGLIWQWDEQHVGVLVRHQASTSGTYSFAAIRKGRQVREWKESLLKEGDHPENVLSHMVLCFLVCLLATDKTIVTPVILNQHRRDDMTPAEIADYATRAIKRSGRIGFDVGRNLERLKATEHYRNGTFAKYYVGKDHERYPKDATESKVAIIQWRAGSIVNRGNLPEIPTGFKDIP